MVDALNIVAVTEFIRKVLKLVSSDLFLAYNTVMEAEDATPIDFSYSATNLWNMSRYSNLCFGDS